MLWRYSNWSENLLSTAHTTTHCSDLYTSPHLWNDRKIINNMSQEK